MWTFYSKIFSKFFKFSKMLFNPENANNRNFLNSRPYCVTITCKLPFLIRLKIRIIARLNRTKPKALYMHYSIISFFNSD